jgi:hypothetical protein
MYSNWHDAQPVILLLASALCEAKRMHLILNIHRTVKLGALLLQHHLLHNEADFQFERREGEVFLRCQRCGLRSNGVQTGPQRLGTRLSGHPTRLRVEMSA